MNCYVTFLTTQLNLQPEINHSKITEVRIDLYFTYSEFFSIAPVHEQYKVVFWKRKLPIRLIVKKKWLPLLEAVSHITAPLIWPNRERALDQHERLQRGVNRLPMGQVLLWLSQIQSIIIYCILYICLYLSLIDNF